MTKILSHTLTILILLVLAGCQTTADGPILPAGPSAYKSGWPVTVSQDYAPMREELLLGNYRMRPVTIKKQDNHYKWSWQGRDSDSAHERHVRKPVSFIENAPDNSWKKIGDKDTSLKAIKAAEIRINDHFRYRGTLELFLKDDGNVGLTGFGDLALKDSVNVNIMRRIIREELAKAHFGPFFTTIPQSLFQHIPGSEGKHRTFFNLAAMSEHYAEFAIEFVTSMHVNHGSHTEQLTRQRFLQFLQLVPYKELTLEEEQGLHTPEQMLKNNIGDCDTKSLFWLAAMRHLEPDRNHLIILTPIHAFVGRQVFDTDPAHGSILHIEGGRYQLIDPTGPQPLPEGVIIEHSFDALQKGHWAYQIVPPSRGPSTS